MTATAPPRTAATPCIKVCVQDLESGFCLGCHRTTLEVVKWQRFTDEEREKILAELPSRRLLIDPTKLG